MAHEPRPSARVRLWVRIERRQTGQVTVIISRRILLGGAAALATGCLAGCSTKFRSYDGPPVTGIVVNKAQRRMYLQSGPTALRGFGIELGGDPVGPKRVEGDLRTPEGAYFIDRRNLDSSYHLSLGISYPNLQDVPYAQSLGRSPGGDIFIHGNPAREAARRQLDGRLHRRDQPPDGEHLRDGGRGRPDLHQSMISVTRAAWQLTLRTHSQNMTVAASAMAERNTLGQRS